MARNNQEPSKNSANLLWGFMWKGYKYRTAKEGGQPETPKIKSLVGKKNYVREIAVVGKGREGKQKGSEGTPLK